MLIMFWIFARIGMFTFGGGPAMLPLIQQTLMEYGWMSLQETIDMVAISQMTPGPFAVNAATFTGMRLFGVCGAALSTLGIMTPSLVMVTIVAHFFFRFRKSAVINNILKGIRPVVPALIAASLFAMGREALVPEANPEMFWPMLVVALVSAALVLRTKVNPAWIMLAAGVLCALFLH